MRVDRVMSGDPQRCRGTDALHGVARAMWRLGCSALPLCNSDGVLLGQLQMRSIYRTVCVDGNTIVGLCVEDVPIDDACSCSGGTDTADALALMTRACVSRLFVVDGSGRLIGYVGRKTMVEVNGIGATKIRRREHGSEDDRGDPYVGWTLIVPHLRLISPSGEVVSIQRNLLRLLLVFLENPGVTLSRHLLLRRVCDREWVSSDRYIDVLVGQLRRKFSDNAGSQRIIRTSHGRGYVFVLEVELDASSIRMPMASRRAGSGRRGQNVAAALAV